MKLRTITLLGVFGLAILLTTCAPPQPPERTPIPPGPSVTGTVVRGEPLLPNLLVGVTGEVQLRRVDWKGFWRAGFGTELRPGDLLRLAPDSLALMFCGDETLWDSNPQTVAGTYEGGIPCPSAPSRRVILPLTPMRFVDLSVIPYIIIPRKTRVMNPHPVLRWHPVPGTKVYRVGVLGAEWETEVTANELVYPSGAPPLVPGVNYKLVVRADNRPSEDEGLPDLGFTLVAAEAQELILAQEAKIRERGLDETATHFLIAELYAAHGLIGEAILELEAIAPEADLPAIHRMLGDLYMEIELETEARGWYEKALDRSRALGDKEGEAAALVGLGQAYGKGGREEAKARLQEALALYQEIGDRRKAQEVAGLLSELGQSD